jgi:hypothetical protein
MEKKNIIKFSTKNLIFSIIIYLIITQINSQNSCNLKIADSLISSFNGNDIIYNFGKIDEERFGLAASKPYSVPIAKEVDFFYVTEIHSVDINKSHDNIVRKIIKCRIRTIY